MTYPDPDTWFLNSPVVKARLDVVSLVNKAPMDIGDMVTFIDLNVHEYGRQILAALKAKSLVGGNEMSVAEFAAWADKYLVELTKLVKSLSPGTYFDAVRHVSTGAVYGFRMGDRPLLWHVENSDEYWSYQSLRLLPPWERVINAEDNLMSSLVLYLYRFAAIGADGKPDVAGIEPLQKAPVVVPKTYTVQQGDTLAKISQTTGVSQENLIAWNKITNPDRIDVGQVLRLEP